MTDGEEKKVVIMKMSPGLSTKQGQMVKAKICDEAKAKNYTMGDALDYMLTQKDWSDQNDLGLIKHIREEMTKSHDINAIMHYEPSEKFDYLSGSDSSGKLRHSCSKNKCATTRISRNQPVSEYMSLGVTSGDKEFYYVDLSISSVGEGGNYEE